MRNVDLKNPGRRNFLRAVPAAAAVGLTLSDASLFAASVAAQDAAESGAGIQVFRADQLNADMQALDMSPGNKSLVNQTSFVMMLTTEKAKTAAEFEWHDGRDHVFQIIEGSTVYELGGSPKGAHSKGPGEWLAPESVDHKTITLNKGDMLVVPRGTPHKRSTPVSVTLLLISPQGSVSS